MATCDVIIPIPKRDYVLTLEQDEVELILALVGSVCGEPETRKYRRAATSIYSAILEACPEMDSISSDTIIDVFEDQIVALK